MENLGIDYKLLIAQVINFAILFFVFKKFIAAPFIKFLTEEKRKEKEKDRILEELETKHERMLDEETKFRKKMKEEQEKILSETKKSAAELKEEMIKSAKAEADALLTRAKEQTEDEKRKFYQEAKKYVADTSISVIENALKDYLTADAQKKLTDHVLTSLKANHKAYEN